MSQVETGTAVRPVSLRAGHSMTNMLLEALFTTEGAFRMRECDSITQAYLPGVGVALDEVPAVA